DALINENCPPIVALDFNGDGLFDLKDVFVIIIVFEDFKQATGPAITSPLTFDANADGQFSESDVTFAVEALLQKT
ncbi:MAG: hypothetical protein AAB316_13870, partial [Bacteroidota bacterium]